MVRWIIGAIESWFSEDGDTDNEVDMLSMCLCMEYITKPLLFYLL